MNEQITVISPGLLGASIAAACRERSVFKRIHVWARRPEVCLELESMQWCDAVFEKIEDSVRDSGLVVICTPVDVTQGILQKIAPYLYEDALVTDVGSTKSLVCRQAKTAFSQQNKFIGSHPMAGSEKAGMAYADAELFEGKSCFVTGLEDSIDENLSQICRFWKQLGMDVTTTTPEKHDEIVAAISHLPHFIASAIVLNLKRKNPSWTAFAGGGFKDSTRIAAGNPDLWRSIFEHNRDELIRAITDFEEVLSEMKSALQNQSWTQLKHLLEQAKQMRDEFND